MSMLAAASSTDDLVTTVNKLSSSTSQQQRHNDYPVQRFTYRERHLLSDQRSHQFTVETAQNTCLWIPLVPGDLVIFR
jgi:hypothetical protein